MNTDVFQKAYTDVCRAFNRPLDQEQAKLFYDKLRHQFDADVPHAVDTLTQQKHFPTLHDWRNAFGEVKRKSTPEKKQAYDLDCPKCKASDSIGFRATKANLDKYGNTTINSTLAICLADGCDYQAPYEQYCKDRAGRGNYGM